MDKLIVALDLDNLEKAEELVDKLYPKVKYFKVGSQLFTNCGPEIIKFIKRKKAKVFLDLKFHDIPNTVASAASLATRLEVDIFNLHACGGTEMMKAALTASEKEAEKLKIKRPKIIAVTVLTSQKSSIEEVLKYASLAKQAGLDGVVASAQEAKAIREKMGKDFIIVTPGIRPGSFNKKDDQKRIATPKEAVENGADYIVVGRPIIEAENPVKVTDEILKEINGS